MYYLVCMHDLNNDTSPLGRREWLIMQLIVQDDVYVCTYTNADSLVSIGSSISCFMHRK
jgi:hypothetical protein